MSQPSTTKFGDKMRELFFVLFVFLTFTSDKIQGDENLYFSFDRLHNYTEEEIESLTSQCLISAFPIKIPDFRRAFNPTLIQFETGFLMVFRLGWAGLGAVLLDHNFHIQSKPQKIEILSFNIEDARLFNVNNELYLTYTDSIDEGLGMLRKSPKLNMCLVKLSVHSDNTITASPPLILEHTIRHKNTRRIFEKNWVPFIYQDKLFLGYTIVPHEILDINLNNGKCSPVYSSGSPTLWKWGELRGGTQALFDEENYISFFHSSIETTSRYSSDKARKHYYMGAYIFSSKPPFEIKYITPHPLISSLFYAPSQSHLRCVFPCGIVIDGNNIYISYGKDDSEVWIAHIDKKMLLQLMIPIEEYHQ